MIVVGLSGSIGMGKSMAAAMLREMRVPVHCADDAVHELLAYGGRGVRPVGLTFPESYDKKKRRIDREKLGALVFGDDAKRAVLENILHPLVQESQQDFLKEEGRRKAKIAVLDIPLLFETGAEERVDYTIVVSAPKFIQRQRVLSRPGMGEEKFAAISARQMPDVEKRRRADFVVQTGSGKAYSYRALKKIIRELQHA